MAHRTSLLCLCFCICIIIIYKQNSSFDLTVPLLKPMTDSIISSLTDCVMLRVDRVQCLYSLFHVMLTTQGYHLCRCHRHKPLITTYFYAAFSHWTLKSGWSLAFRG